MAGAVGTSRRRGTVAAIAVPGVLAAVLVATALPTAERTVAAVNAPAQLLMSVLVPLVGVLLAGDLRRSGAAAVPPAVLGALLVSTAVALYGVLVSVAAVAVVPSEAAADGWPALASVALGSAGVQGVAQLAGLGLGLLLRPPVLAFGATIVLPLGLWLLLGLAGPLRPARDWVTPFANAPDLMSGRTTPLDWAQLAVVVALWGLGPIAAGVSRWRSTG